MKKLFYLMAILAVSIIETSCSDKEPSDNGGNRITTLAGHSFSYLTNDESLQDLTYSIEFFDNDVFAFYVNINGVNGKQLGRIVNFYSIEDGNIVFDQYTEPVRFTLQSITPPYNDITYRVIPKSAEVIHSEKNTEEIDGVSLTLEFDGNSNPVTFLMTPRGAHTDFQLTIPNLKEQDFAGSIWTRRTNYDKNFVFFEDHTYMLGEWNWYPGMNKPFDEFGIWGFDEATQTLTTNEADFVSRKNRLINEIDGTYYTNRGVKWKKTTIEEAFKGNPADMFLGPWVDDSGRTLDLQISGQCYVSGTAAPGLPAGSDTKIYREQRLILEGGFSGNYRIGYSGQIVAPIPDDPHSFVIVDRFSEVSEILGTYEVKDCFKSLEAQRLVMTGAIDGTFRRSE